MANTEFRVMKDIVQPDSRGRIYLGSAVASKLYRASTNDLGQILLEPVVAIPEREAWLFEHPDALSAVKQGLQESAEGLATSLGSFAESADGSLPEFIQKMRLAAAVKWGSFGLIMLNPPSASPDAFYINIFRLFRLTTACPNLVWTENPFIPRLSRESPTY